MRPIAIVLLLAATAAAQDVAYEKIQLENGMTVILHEDHTIPVAAVNLWYRVGSKDEPVRRSGFAHLFEHLMFMGTKRVPGGDYDAIMSAGGGDNNASTGEDRTNYFSHGPASLLRTLLWLEADRLEDLGANMTQEKLDRQREIVRNERRQTDENRPYGKAELALTGLLYPEGHPYHIPVIGTHEDLEAATLQDVKDFFAAHYVPNNVTLVVAGDFEPAATKELVKKLFGSIPRGAEAAHRTAGPVKLPGIVRETVVDKVQLARVTLAWHSPANFAEGDAEMDLAAAVLSQGKTSRLYKRLVYDEKLCAQVHAAQDSNQLGSVFRVDLTPRTGADLDKVEKVADEEIARFLESGPTKEELERIVAEHELGTLSSLQSVERIADMLNEYDYYLGEPNSVKRDLDRYRNATPEGVRDRARSVIVKERVVLRVLPEAPPHAATARDERPAAAPSKAFEPALPETFRLSNGIAVQVFRRPALPLVSATLLFKPSFVLGDAEGKQAGLAAITAQMLKEGAGDLDALSFDSAMQLLGARFASSAGAEHATVSLTVLERNFERASGLVATAVKEPRLTATDWERTKRLHLESLRRRDDNPGSVAANVAHRLLYGDRNPLAWPTDGTAASIGGLTLDDVKDEHRALYRPDACTIVVAGDVTAEKVKALLERLYGGWKPEPAAARASHELPAPLAREKLRVALVDRPDAVQTVIRFQMPAPRWQDEKRVSLRMFNNIFGGSFSSRLNQNLREAHGYTYGASSRFSLEPGWGTFVASSSVRADVTGASLKEFLGEISRIREGTVTPAEASRARETLRSDAIRGTGDLSGLVGLASEYALNGASFEQWKKDLEKLDAGEAALNALAKDAIPLERGVLVLVGDKKLILQQLKGLGLDEPVEVDARGALK